MGESRCWRIATGICFVQEIGRPIFTGEIAAAAPRGFRGAGRRYYGMGRDVKFASAAI